MKALIIIVVMSLPQIMFGQNTIKKIIFFDLGKSEITSQNKLHIDSFCAQIKTKVDKLVLIGHADSVGNESYNLTLSNRRVQKVSQYLTNKGFVNSEIKNEYYGELKPIFSNKSDEERVKNRCVEIIAVLDNPNSKTNGQKELERMYEERYGFENDTLIDCPNGTKIEISSKTFYPIKIKDIKFEVTEIFSFCDMLNNNTVTRDVDGNCLTSAGMIYVKPMFDGVEVQPNEGQFLKIKIPVQNGKIDKSMKLYAGVLDTNNEIKWKYIDSEISYEKNGFQYYVFKMDTVMPYNLDKPIGVVCKKDGHKIKIPNFIDAVICQTYPEENYLSIAEKKKNRKFILDKIDDEKKPVISILAYDKFGNPYSAAGPLLELKYRKWNDTYVVDKSYFRKIKRDYSKKMSKNDYLCNLLNN